MNSTLHLPHSRKHCLFSSVPPNKRRTKRNVTAFTLSIEIFLNPLLRLNLCHKIGRGRSVIGQINGAEPVDGAAQAFVQRNLWLPPKRFLGQRNVRLPARWIILRKRPTRDHFGFCASDRDNFFGELLHGEFICVSQIDRTRACLLYTSDAADE